MDQNFRKRLQKTLYCGELEPEHKPLTLTEVATDYYHDLTPHAVNQIDLESAANITSQETVSPSSVVMSMMYVKRLKHKRPDYTGKMSSSDLFIISMMMASKYLYDEGVDEEVFNDEWADNAGLDKELINNMELDFLDALDWELFIGKEDFEQAMLCIEKSIARRQGLRRGWFSYTDLGLLLDDAWIQLSESGVRWQWWKVVVISCVVYTAGLLTLLASAMLVTHMSMAVASSGLQPDSLQSTNKTPDNLPQTSPCILVLPSVHISEISLSNTAAFPIHQTEDAVVEESELISRKEQDLVSKNGQQIRPQDGIIDRALSQLEAVLTLKSHLMQFVTAVSDGYSSSGMNANRSERKTSYSHTVLCIDSACDSECMKEEDIFDIDNESCMLKSLVDCDGALKCQYCGRQQTFSRSGVETDSNIICSSLESTQCHGIWRKGHVCLQQDQSCDNYLIDQGDKTDPKRPHSLQHAVKSHSVETIVTVHAQFPDITVGFSTSMPLHVFDT